MAEIVGPAQRIQFLGLFVDSIEECLEIPLDKLQALCDLTQSYSERIKLTRKELEVIGDEHMSFAGKVIYGACTFTRILIDALHRLKSAKQRIGVTILIRSELLWWKTFAGALNGLSYCSM